MLYLIIDKGTDFVWTSWGWSDQPEPPHSEEVSFCFALQDGSGFLHQTSTKFDRPDYRGHYDPARCGAFADWLEENEDRLLEGFSTEDRPLAQERLAALRDWLRSGFQKSS